MTLTYRSVAIFGAGPLRVSRGVRGLFLVSDADATGDPRLPGSSASGELELAVIVRGRLVASDEASLNAARQGVLAMLDAGSGRLEDGRGGRWDGMTLTRFVEADRTDRGRLVSVGYEAWFARLTGIGAGGVVRRRSPAPGRTAAGPALRSPGSGGG